MSKPFSPTTSRSPPSDDPAIDGAFGSLTEADTSWLCAGGFSTETQTYYTMMPDGKFLLCQVIYSSVGLWYPTVQFTCKYYDPATKEQVWNSVNVGNWTCPAPGKDKRSCKSDQFSITLNTSGDSEEYEIRAKPNNDIQIFLTVKRVAKGFKFGSGPKGGYSYFGANPDKPDGFVVHRFWPRTAVEGHVMLKGKAVPIEKAYGMMVHAIQGMRPNLVASRWNFADFQSEDGTSAIQMEFTTLTDYGSITVNLGCLCQDNKLVAVTGETLYGDDRDSKEPGSRATHYEPTFDKDTSYEQPKRIGFVWRTGEHTGELEVNVGGPDAPQGLLEKVDVLAEIPYIIRKFVNYVAGTKPYIYQWLNPVELKISGRVVKGWLFNEATFISK